MRKLHLVLFMVFSMFLLGNTTITTPDYCSVDYQGEQTYAQMTYCASLLVDNTPIEVPSYCSLPNDERTDDDGNDYSQCESPTPLTDEVYEGEFVTSEGTYNRIQFSRDTMRWTGVVLITAYDVHDKDFAKTDTWINLQFSRELENLNMIELEYTSEKECENIGIFGWCIGGVYESETFKETIYNKVNDGAWNENLFISNDQIIRTTSNQVSFGDSTEYDYTIFLKEIPLDKQIDTIKFLQFEFVLTNEEIDQLKIDVQDQYEYEVNQIKNDPESNLTEKNIALEDLNEEYSQMPEIVYDMVFAHACPEDVLNCVIVTEPSNEQLDPEDDGTPLWAEDIVDTILKGVSIVAAALVGGTMITVIVSMIIRKTVETTGSAVWTTTKGGIKTGEWIGKRIGLGILAFMGIIYEGIKALGKWNVLLWGLVLLLAIIIL